MPDYASFSTDDGKRIATATTFVERTMRNTQPSSLGVTLGFRDMRIAVYEGFLLDDLEPSTSNGENTTSARLRIKGGKGSDWSNTRTIAVTNRNDSFSASEGDYIQVIELNGEFRPLVGGTGTSSTDCDDCSPWSYVPRPASIECGELPAVFTIDFGDCWDLFDSAFAGDVIVQQVDPESPGEYVSAARQVKVAEAGTGSVVYTGRLCPEKQEESNTNGNWRVQADSNSPSGKRWQLISPGSGPSTASILVSGTGNSISLDDYNIGDNVILGTVRNASVWRVLFDASGARQWDQVGLGHSDDSDLACGSCNVFLQPADDVNTVDPDLLYYGRGPFIGGESNQSYCWELTSGECEDGFSSSPPNTEPTIDGEEIEVACTPNEGTSELDLCAVPTEDSPEIDCVVRFNATAEPPIVSLVLQPEGADEITVATWTISLPLFRRWGRSKANLASLGCDCRIADATKGPGEICVRASNGFVNTTGCCPATIEIPQAISLTVDDGSYLFQGTDLDHVFSSGDTWDVSEDVIGTHILPLYSVEMPSLASPRGFARFYRDIETSMLLGGTLSPNDPVTLRIQFTMNLADYLGCAGLHCEISWMRHQSGSTESPLVPFELWSFAASCEQLNSGSCVPSGISPAGTSYQFNVGCVWNDLLDGMRGVMASSNDSTGTVVCVDCPGDENPDWNNHNGTGCSSFPNFARLVAMP